MRNTRCGRDDETGDLVGLRDQYSKRARGNLVMCVDELCDGVPRQELDATGEIERQREGGE